MACTSDRECVVAAQPEPVHLVVMGHRSPGSEAAGEVRRATEGLPGLEFREHGVERSGMRLCHRLCLMGWSGARVEARSYIGLRG